MRFQFSPVPTQGWNRWVPWQLHVWCCKDLTGCFLGWLHHLTFLPAAPECSEFFHILDDMCHLLFCFVLPFVLELPVGALCRGSLRGSALLFSNPAAIQHPSSISCFAPFSGEGFSQPLNLPPQFHLQPLPGHSDSHVHQVTLCLDHLLWVTLPSLGLLYLCPSPFSIL